MRRLYLFGTWIGVLLQVVSWITLLEISGTYGRLWQFAIAYCLAVYVGVVAHELGHLAACRACGARVAAFRLGHDRLAVRFHARQVLVSLSFPYQGRVEHYEAGLSLGRRMTIIFAGPLADLMIGAALVAASGWGARLPLAVAALGFGFDGLKSLLPYRAQSGRLSDGARLLALPKEARAVAALRAAQTATRLQRADRIGDLLAFHTELEFPERPIEEYEAQQLALLEGRVLTVAGLPAEHAALAGKRLGVLEARRHGAPQPIVTVTLMFVLALLRLRLGGREGYAAAERLCDQALAMTGQFKGDSAGSLEYAFRCLLVVSRQALALSCDDVREAAGADLPWLDLGTEQLTALLDPEGYLAAFRAGAPGSRLGVGSVAGMLRYQERTAELRELHEAFLALGNPVPAESLMQIEYHLLVRADVPGDVAEQAASQLERVIASYPFEAKRSELKRHAVQQALAVARLRQGRPGEVESLCAAALTEEKDDPCARATVLATVALARQALGLPCADLIAEAVALDPEADLVAEARAAQEAGPAMDTGPHGVVTRALATQMLKDRWRHRSVHA